MRISSRSFGPWTTSLDNSTQLELSAFWRRRMQAIADLPLAPRKCGRRALGGVALAALFVTGAPLCEFHPVQAVAQEPQEPQSAGQEESPTEATIFDFPSHPGPMTDAEQKEWNDLYQRSLQLQKELTESHGYHLAPGELLKFVPAEQGGEVRRELVRLYAGDSQLMFSFCQKDGQLIQVTTKLDETPLRDVLDVAVRVKVHRIVCDPAVLEIPLEGDWIFAQDPSAWRDENQAEKFQVESALVEALDATLRPALPKPLRIELRTVDHEALVASGDYQFTVIPNAEGKIQRLPEQVGERADGEFQFPAHRDEIVGSVGAFPELLEDVGELLLMPIVDEIATRPKKPSYFWGFNDKVHVTGKTPLDAATTDATIAALAKQTNLTFTRETRPVQMLFIKPADAKP